MREVSKKHWLLQEPRRWRSKQNIPSSITFWSWRDLSRFQPPSKNNRQDLQQLHIVAFQKIKKNQRLRMLSSTLSPIAVVTIISQAMPMDGSPFEHQPVTLTVRSASREEHAHLDIRARDLERLTRLQPCPQANCKYRQSWSMMWNMIGVFMPPVLFISKHFIQESYRSFASLRSSATCICGSRLSLPPQTQ